VSGYIFCCFWGELVVKQYTWHVCANDVGLFVGFFFCWDAHICNNTSRLKSRAIPEGASFKLWGLMRTTANTSRGVNAEVINEVHEVASHEAGSHEAQSMEV